MRRLATLTAAAVLAGCGGRSAQPVELSRPAPAPAAQTLDCVARELDRMDYTITSQDRQAGVIRATYVNEQPWWRRIIGISNTADQITATVSQGQLQVTATSSDPTEPPADRAGAQAPGAASAAAQNNARQLVSACGGG